MCAMTANFLDVGEASGTLVRHVFTDTEHTCTYVHPRTHTHINTHRRFPHNSECCREERKGLIAKFLARVKAEEEKAVIPLSAGGEI